MTSPLRGSGFKLCPNNDWKKALMFCGSVNKWGPSHRVTECQSCQEVTLAHLWTLEEVGLLGEKTLTQGHLRERATLWWEPRCPKYFSYVPLAFALVHFASGTHKHTCIFGIYPILGNLWLSYSQLTPVFFRFQSLVLSELSTKVSSLTLEMHRWGLVASESTLRCSQLQSTLLQIP